jgi:hypothetical protein
MRRSVVVAKVLITARPVVRSTTYRSRSKTYATGDTASLSVQPPDDLDSSTILRRFEKLTSFYGAGRKLTATGQPTVADAKALVGLLDLDDEIDPKIGQRIFSTRSASELPDLSRTLYWAVRSGALRKVHRRCATTKS